MGSDPERVVLDGVLSIRTVQAIRIKLLQALTEHPALTIDCDAAETVDLGFIQLLLAARLSAARLNKPFTLAAPASGALRATLLQGGLLPSEDGPETATDGFWTGAA